MSGISPPREGLTTFLVETLRTALAGHDPVYGVGDGIAPAEFGWPDGQPGVGEFAAYTVLLSLTGQPQRRDGFDTAQPNAWTFPYSLSSWGEMRQQADAVADAADAVICGIDHRALKGVDSPVAGFDIQQISVNPIGPTERSDQTAPQMWNRKDTVTVWLARANAGRRG